MLILNNVFNFQSSGHQFSSHNICFLANFAHSSLGHITKVILLCFNNPRYQVWDVRGSSSGIAAPAAFYSGSTHITVYRVETEIIKPQLNQMFNKKGRKALVSSIQGREMGGCKSFFDISKSKRKRKRKAMAASFTLADFF